VLWKSLETSTKLAKVMLLLPSFQLALSDRLPSYAALKESYGSRVTRDLYAFFDHNIVKSMKVDDDNECWGVHSSYLLSEIILFNHPNVM